MDAPSGAGYDFERKDHRQIIEVRSPRGVRDLHAALLQLALAADERPSIERAYLIARFPRMSPHRVASEWERVRRVLNPHTMSKLALVAIAGDDFVPLPDDEETRHLANLAENTFEVLERARYEPSTLSGKFFEVWKALLRAWLAREGPLPISELGSRAGCSYPTTAKALERLGDGREIERDRSRAVSLRAFPRETLGEVMVLAGTLRRPAFFIEATGQEPDLQLILRRLQITKPPCVALGGVVAARHYDPHLDLHGLPRVDVVMHEPLDLSWVRRVDPALQQATPRELSPALVVRPLGRPAADFTVVSDLELPIADPVETLLDLYELRLNEQAEELVRALRRGIR